MFMDRYESRVRVSMTPNIPVHALTGRASLTRQRSYLEWNRSACAHISTRDPKWMTCMVANQTPIIDKISSGWALQFVIPYKYSRISDYIGKWRNIKVTKKVPYYVYPTSKCRKYHRMGDPRVRKCRKVKYRTISYMKRVRYRPEGLAFESKPVTHISENLWVEGDFVVDPKQPGKYTYGPLLDPIAYSLPEGITEFSPHELGTSPFPLGKPAEPINIPGGVQTVDIYREIALGLPGIGGFTLSTEANLLVSILEIKSTLLLFARGIGGIGLHGRLASAFLMYNFAIAPTIGDIMTIIEMDSKLQKAIRKWNKTAGKANSWHFQCSREIPLYKHTTSDGVISTFREYRSEGVGTLTLIGKHLDYPSLTDHLRMYGFDKPLSAIWELIPFSFILDWFTSVAEYIEAFETKTSPARFTVTQAVYSITNTGFGRLERNKSDYFLSSPKVHQEKKVYKRGYLNLSYINSSKFMEEQGAWRPENRFGFRQGLLLTALAVVLQPSLRR